jgi:hypothetical protein
VGQNEWEEVDVRTPRQQHYLNNYGWRVWEGRARYTSGQRTNREGRLVFPIVTYKHEGGRCSVTGGYVYRGQAVAAAQGRYFFGDYCSGTVSSFRIENGSATDVRREPFRVDQLTSFGEDARGELYMATGTGRIYKLGG